MSDKVKQALAMYNAPLYPYNTPKDINEFQQGFGKLKRGKGLKRLSSKKGNGRRRTCGKGRRRIQKK